MKNTTFPRMHISLYVSNIQETANFYSRFFDQAPAKMMSDYCKFELAEPSLIISFVQNAEKVGNQFGQALSFDELHGEIVYAPLGAN